MLIILIFVAGAFFNRCRGGLLEQVRITSFLPPQIRSKGKIINDICFGLLFSWLSNSALSYEFAKDTALYGFAMFYGRHFGWGNYIGAIIRKDTSYFTEAEVDFIDAKVKRYLHRPVLYGTLALTMRGLLWAAFISMALNSLIPLLAGMLMGVVYCTVITLCGKTEDERARGWGYSEYVFGGILWATCAYALV